MSHIANVEYVKRMYQNFQESDVSGRKAIVRELKENGFDEEAHYLEGMIYHND